MLFGDVLKEAGAPKAVQAIGGFGLDVALDPTTYVTLGASAPAKLGAKVAGRKVTKEGSRRLTVGVGKKRVTTPVGLPTLSDKTRKRLGKAFPVRPPDITPEQWSRLKAVDRRRRGTVLAEGRRSANRARAVRKAMGGAQRRVLPERPAAGARRRKRPGRVRTAPLEASRRVRDAIESQNLGGLSRNERLAAEAIVREQERLFQMRRASGEKAARWAPRTADEPPGYMYRLSTKVADEPDDVDRLVLRPAMWRKIRRTEKVARTRSPHARAPRRTTTVKDWQRGDRRPMREIREQRPGAYVEDVPTTLLAKAQQDITRAANTGYRNQVMQMGRKLEPNAKWDPDTEGVFTVKEGRLTEVSHKTFSAGKPEDHVILPKAVAAHANEQVARRAPLPFIDPLVNKVKFALTVPNPQYWSRNYYGGLFNTWQAGTPAAQLARAVPAAHRVAHRQGRIAKTEETLGAKLKPAGKIQLGKGGGKVDVDDFIRELESMNVSGGGITSELLGAETRRRSKMQAFEDVPRLAAYIHSRRKGLDPDAAAEQAMRSQFDYGALTAAEMNVARRIFPFYTWRSRNIMLQAETMAQRPGRLATFQKGREELANAAGLPENWEQQLQEHEALGIPMPIPGTKQLLYPALPVTDLNLFTADPAQWLQQTAGMVNPLVKWPTEFWTGYSFFFRDQMENPHRRWFSAPDRVINNMPAPFRQQLIKAGIIRMGKDNWTGQTTWQWRGKTDYIARLVPITSTLFAAGTSGRSRKGQKSEQQVAGWLTGLRSAPFEPERNRLYRMYEERYEKLQKRIDDLEELGLHKTKSAKEYRRLQARAKELDIKIYGLEGKVGKKLRGEAPSGAGSSSLLDSGSGRKSLLDAGTRKKSILD